MMKLLPFHRSHAQMIELSASQKPLMLSMLGDPVELAERYAAGGTAFTGVHEGAVVGIAGLVVLWPGVAEAWALMSDRIEGLPFQVTRAIARGLFMEAQNFGLHRIQAVVAADDERAQRWIEILGFRFEGLMRAYGPDRSNYLRFARIR